MLSKLSISLANKHSEPLENVGHWQVMFGLMAWTRSFLSVADQGWPTLLNFNVKIVVLGETIIFRVGVKSAVLCNIFTA